MITPAVAPDARRRTTTPSRLVISFLCVTVLLTLTVRPAASVTMTNDPRGFHQLKWGASLKDQAEFTALWSDERIVDYRSKESPAQYGGADVDSVVLSTIDNAFARVTIRYHGDEIHKRVLTYLEQTYGTIDRLPGQMMRGLNQQYNWRGPETEINLIYESNRDRGYIFIESRTLSPRFNDRISDTAD